MASIKINRLCIAWGIIIWVPSENDVAIVTLNPAKIITKAMVKTFLVLTEGNNTIKAKNSGKTISIVTNIVALL